jgi:LysM repeat protein
MPRRKLILIALVIVITLSNIMVAQAAPAAQPIRDREVYQGGTHTVQRGETLGGIALKYGTTVDALMRANGISNASLIVTGQRLVIPGRSSGTASSAGGGTYTVKPGDTLSAIAVRYNTTIDRLMALNGISNARYIYPGQVLRVGGSAPASSGGGAAASSAPAVYTVRRGDSLSAIAARYGTTVAALMAANALTRPNLIVVGQRLRIPGGSGGAAAGANTYQASGSGLRFMVSISQQRCQLMSGNKVLNNWRCSTGRQGSGTKAGTFRIQSKIRNAWGSRWGFWMPYWLGIYWAGKSENGIHGQPWWPKGGTVWAGLVGTPITYGCVMLDNTAAAALYNVAYIGMPVTIRY